MFYLHKYMTTIYEKIAKTMVTNQIGIIVFFALPNPKLRMAPFFSNKNAGSEVFMAPKRIMNNMIAIDTEYCLKSSSIICICKRYIYYNYCFKKNVKSVKSGQIGSNQL